ncbi:AbrB family transcriptional regulator [Caenimonas terrae]|uniref:AbrB family transcriptional regulator n=1 Tax=Caenimonas terrae TaxID=696074 RepID=A0ABW0NAP5_9BURK
MPSRAAARIALSLLLALAAALACAWLRTPLPWMIGPLVATAAASMRGAPTQSWSPLRNLAQWTIGTALGLYFTPQVAGLLASLWWVIGLAVLWALALGWMFGAWMYRCEAGRLAGTEHQKRATCYFAGSIGGASEMTLLSEREGARTDLVAASHSLRLLSVTILIPFAFTFSGMHGLDPTPPGPRLVQWGGLGLLALATGAGSWLAARSGRPNPWFLGALLVSMGLTTFGVELSALPDWMTKAAQLVIGVSLGVRFEGRFVHTAPRWLLSVLLGTLGMIALSAGFAALLAWGTGVHPATMILGTSPGGITEMAITAKVLQLGVPMVTALQVCRLVAVLVLVGPLFRWRYGQAKQEGFNA